MCVYAGITSCACFSARSASMPTSSQSCDIAPSAASRTYSLRSVATWSFLLLAVCSFLPTSPMRETSAFSTNEWISSAPDILSLPPSISSRMESKPSLIVLASASGIIPVAPSMVQCATEQAMSCRYIALSKGRESLNSSASPSSSAVNLPDQSFIIFYRFCPLSRCARASSRAL